MNNNLCVIKLVGEKDYAIVTPGRIVFALDASDKEFKEVISEEEKIQNNFELEEDDPFESVSIIPTMNCNLACIYCYARGGEVKKILPLESAKNVIRDIRSRSQRSDLHLHLVGGGEPLLDLNYVSRLVDFSETLFDEVYVYVVTNGAFDDNTLKWLVNKGVNVRLSYDGVMQDIQRPFRDGSRSSALVESNIRKLVQRGVDPITQCLLTQRGLKHTFDSIDLLLSLGVKTIKIEPVLTNEISRGSIKLEPDPKEFATTLMEAIEYVALNSTKYPGIKLDTGFFGKPTSGYYCGMSRQNVTVTPYETVTSCVEIVRLEDPFAEKVIFGNLTKDGIKVNQEKREWLSNVHFSNYAGGCPSCKYRLICAGGCPIHNIWRGGLPIRKSEFTCKVEHTLLPNLLTSMAEDAKIRSVVLDNTTEIC
ncbi:MAG: radical SAM protein [Patescibacteria group bacterium]